MISVMVANLVTNKIFAKKFVPTLLQGPLHKFGANRLFNKTVSNLLFGQKCGINGPIVTSKWSELFRCINRKLIRLPVAKKSTRSFIAPRKSVMLLSASVFLGYHKDGKRKRIFQPDTESLSNRQEDAAKIAEEIRQRHRKTILGRLLAIYVWFTEVIYVIYRTLQLCFYFSPLFISAPIARYNRKFRIKIWYSMLVKVLEYCGPIFVKLGQWASTRRDIFSDELCEELSKLQRYARTHSWKHTQKILETSIGPLWYFKFEDFETKPIGSGACAQVYMAKVNLSKLNHEKSQGEADDDLNTRLHNGPDWVPVAVKVLHPNIVCRFERDLGVFQALVNMAYLFIPSLEWVSFRDSLEEFAFQMQVQLDLTTEAENMLQFGADYKENSSIIFPKPIVELCTPELLVQTYEEGVHIQNYLSDLSALPEDARKKISDLGADLMLKMVFENNFVHGDLHPGNILVRGSLDNPSQLKLVILDSGMVATLTPGDFQNLHDTFRAVVKGDGRKVGKLFLERTKKNYCRDPEKFITELALIVDDAQKQRITFNNSEVAALLLRVFNTLRNNQVKLDANFAAVILSIMVLEGLARQMDPDMDLIRKSAPYLLRKYLNSKRESIVGNVGKNRRHGWSDKLPLEGDIIFT